MTHARTTTLVVLTLLQLCRANTKNSLNQPDEWYLANIAEQARHSPQPISEIFSTSSVSPSQPIVVVPSSSSSPLEYDDISSAKHIEIEVTSQAPFSPSLPSSTYSSSYSSSYPAQSSSFTPETQYISTSTFAPSSPQQFSQTDSYSSQPPSIVFPDQSQPLLVGQLGVLNVQNQTNYFINQPSTPVSTQSITTSPISPQSTLRTTLAQSPQTTVTIQPRPQSTSTYSTPSSSFVTKTKSVTVSNPSSPIPFPVMKIRVRAPSGSVTNIRFVSSTTKKPSTKRTTRAPKSKNTYGACIRICGGRRDPICASPLSKQIHADNLKGFPSMCHLACHNSFKSDRYEKVVEGKCGKLRTHIRTLGSKKKLKKEELQKTQYTLVHDNDEAIVEFESLAQKH